jgi:hypothetical protein
MTTMTHGTPNPVSPSRAHPRNAASRSLVCKSPQRRLTHVAEQALLVIVAHLTKASKLFSASARATCEPDHPIQIP